MALYFGPEVDAKIVEYRACEDRRERDKIFEEHIRPAMLKLIESQMYMYGFYRIDDPETLKNECLSNIYEIIPKFDPTRGKKAFSYFNVVVKHWFIWKHREKTKRLKNEANNFLGIDHEIVKNDPSVILGSHEDEIVEKEFWLSLHRDMDRWRLLLKKPSEIKVLDAVVFLLQNPQLVSIYNKKAVFMYMKEMTGMNMKQVTHNLNSLRTLYLKFRERFHNGDEEESG